MSLEHHFNEALGVGYESFLKQHKEESLIYFLKHILISKTRVEALGVLLFAIQ